MSRNKQVFIENFDPFTGFVGKMWGVLRENIGSIEGYCMGFMGRLVSNNFLGILLIYRTVRTAVLESCNMEFCRISQNHFFIEQVL